MVKKGLIIAVTILSFFCIENAQATNVSYKYDSLSRLVEVQYENVGKIEYTYDASGNRLSQKVTKPAACVATLDGNLLLNLPYISYVNSMLEALSFWADFVYEFNPTYPTLIPFKLTNVVIINNPSFSCAASTLSSDLSIHIPYVLFPDGINHIWVDLIYSLVLSTDGNNYWVVSNYGFN